MGKDINTLFAVLTRSDVVVNADDHHIYLCEGGGGET